jgi:hypothetical protein
MEIEMNFKRAIITLMVLMLLPGLALAQVGTARFEVQKLWEDNDFDPVKVTDEVDVMIVCNTGVPLEQEATISTLKGVVFVVLELLDAPDLVCTITETVPAGYEADYHDGVLNDPDACVYTGGELGNMDFDNFCLITNRPLPVPVSVTKEWDLSGAGSQDIDTELYVHVESYNLIVGGYECGYDGDLYWCLDIHFDGVEFGDSSSTETETFLVYPSHNGTAVYLHEDVYDSAVESSSTCGSNVGSISGNGGGMNGGSMYGMVTVFPGQGASCTFTNTAFFEGIPTLSQYGLAIMALLMLGVGFVGFRRFV